jgi:ATP-dependent Lon protease
MDADAQDKLHESLAALPLFPLPQAFLFPGALLPLHVFEPRYRALLRDCLAIHRHMAIVQILGAGPDGSPRIAPVAGVGVILDHQTLPDGRSNLVLQGRGRVRLQELEFVAPYRRARAELLADDDVRIPEHEKVALVHAAAAFAQEIKRHDPDFELRLSAQGDAGRLADLCAHQLIIDTELRQRLLETTDPVTRVRLVTQGLARQSSALGSSPPAVLN